MNIDSVSIWDLDSQWLVLVILGLCSSIVVTSDSEIVISPAELLQIRIKIICLVHTNETICCIAILRFYLINYIDDFTSLIQYWVP